MISDGHRFKRSKPGECMICDTPNPTKHTTIGASFCAKCWEALGDEDELEKRMKWPEPPIQQER